MGFCTVLLLTGITKIDPALYESAQDRWRGLVHRVLSDHRPAAPAHEIGVCLTVTVIAALAAFDIVYVATAGGPGNSTAVPGIQIYILAFTEQQIGLASALAVMLMVLVLVVILPIQRLSRESTAMRVARCELWAGRVLLLVLMAYNAPALYQHLYDRAASVRDCTQWSRMAREPAVGQLCRSL